MQAGYRWWAGTVAARTQAGWHDIASREDGGRGICNPVQLMEPEYMRVPTQHGRPCTRMWQEQEAQARTLRYSLVCSTTLRRDWRLR